MSAVTQAVAQELVTAQPDRSKFIGGSDIAALLKIAPSTWTRNSPVALYNDKTLPRGPEKPARGVLKRGKRWEGAVAEMLVERLEAEGHKVEIVDSNKRYQHPDYPMFACEIDFEIRLDGSDEITNVELKTVHPFKAGEWGEDGTDTCPIYYQAQCLWGLGITGRRLGMVAPLFGADELRVYPVGRDEITLDAIIARAKTFWFEHVIPMVPPSPQYLADLDLLYPAEKEGPALVADMDLMHTFLRMRELDAAIQSAGTEYDRLEFDLKRAMGDCAELIIGERVAATWKLRKNSHLDQAALKEAHPKIVKEFTRAGQSRVFTPKFLRYKE